MSTRKHGYYIAIIPGAADGEVIVYWDGIGFHHHGSTKIDRECDFLWVASEPIDLKSLSNA